MMGPSFWKGLADKVGYKVKTTGAPIVRMASAALGEIEVVPLPDRIPLREAMAAGFYRCAKPMGWGLYRAEDIDGGLGSIWSIEKGADGNQFLVKQVSPEGEVMRKSASAALIERVAVAPPGEEKLVKKLKHDPEVDNPWAVAWSVHNKKKASALCGSCGHGHDGDVCDDCGCRIFMKKATLNSVLGPLSTVNAVGLSSSDIKTAGEGEAIYDQVLAWMKQELTKALGPGEIRLGDEELGMKAMEQFGIDAHEASGILVIAHSETGA